MHRISPHDTNQRCAGSITSDWATRVYTCAPWCPRLLSAGDAVGDDLRIRAGFTLYMVTVIDIYSVKPRTTRKAVGQQVRERALEVPRSSSSTCRRHG
jgi:hypothetical protein